MMKKTSYLLVLIAMSIFLVACEEDHGLTADAGPTQEVNVGIQVVLNSDGSTDLNGTGYSSSWSFVSVPAGSDAAITGATQTTATFIPDVVGTYVINLTISNEAGSSSAQVTIVALPAMSVEIGGSYSDHLHLTKIVSEPGVPDYIVTSNLTASTRLTIDPGVIIAVGSNYLIRVTSNGVLDAQGTEEEPIIITGTSQIAGFWRGVFVESSNLENIMDHVHIAYAGSNIITAGTPRSGLLVSSGRLTIKILDLQILMDLEFLQHRHQQGSRWRTITSITQHLLQCR